jgi:hypothetical protein
MQLALFSLYLYFQLLVLYRVKYIVTFAWVILFLFSSFRYQIGTDYQNYIDIFMSIIQGNEFYRITREFGFVYLIDLINYIGGGYQLFFFVTSFFTIFFLYKGFKYFSDSKMIFILITALFIPSLYLYGLNAVRQILATAIFLYSAQFIIKREFLKYALGIFFAVSFHYTAIVLLPLYWIIHKKLNTFFIVFLIVFFISGTFLYIIEIALSQVGMKYINYFFHEEFSASRENKYLLYTIYLFGIGIVVYFQKFFSNKPLIYNAIIIYFLFKIVSIDMSILNRLSVYFKPFYIIGMVYIFYFSIAKLRQAKSLVSFSILIYILVAIIITPLLLSFIDTSYTDINFNINLFSNEPYIIEFTK